MHSSSSFQSFDFGLHHPPPPPLLAPDDPASSFSTQCDYPSTTTTTIARSPDQLSVSFTSLFSLSLSLSLSLLRAFSPLLLLLYLVFASLRTSRHICSTVKGVTHHRNPTQLMRPGTFWKLMEGEIFPKHFFSSVRRGRDGASGIFIGRQSCGLLNLVNLNAVNRSVESIWSFANISIVSLPPSNFHEWLGNVLLISLVLAIFRPTYLFVIENQLIRYKYEPSTPSVKNYRSLSQILAMNLSNNVSKLFKFSKM